MVRVGDRATLAWWSGALAITILATAWMANEWGGEFATVVFTNVLHLSAAVAATALCWRRAATEDVRAARGWRWMAFACWCWAMGQLAWMAHEFVFQHGVPIAERSLPFPFISDVGFLLFFPGAILGLVLMPQGLFRSASRLRLGQDATLIALSVLQLAWLLFLAKAAQTALEEDTLATIVLLAYPTGDLALTGLAVLAAAYAREGERSALYLLMLAAVVLTATDAAFFVLAQPGDVYVSVVDVGWPIALMLIGLAALRRPRADAIGDLSADEPRSHWLASGLAVAAMAAALTRIGKPFDPFTAALAVTIFLVLAWRWTAIARERRTARRLASSLASSPRGSPKNR